MPIDIKFIAQLFSHTKDAVFGPSLPWAYRWRLLGLQPITWLTYLLKYTPWMFSRRYSVIEIPTRGRHTLRAIVFLPPHRPADRPSPLHIDFHGGAFLGGLAEYDANWCAMISDRTGAVVVSAQYRYAPVNIYPCAHEDAEDVISWVLANARAKWDADPALLTVSGESAGADLMMVAGNRAKAAVGNCAVVRVMLLLHGSRWNPLTERQTG
jgi:acetyl esterase/lipase